METTLDKGALIHPSSRTESAAWRSLFVEAETLREHVRREKLSLTSALDAARQVASALAAAHAAGMCAATSSQKTWWRGQTVWANDATAIGQSLSFNKAPEMVHRIEFRRREMARPGYEPKGRTFESCRAYNEVSSLRQVRRLPFFISRLRRGIGRALDKLSNVIVQRDAILIPQIHHVPGVVVIQLYVFLQFGRQPEVRHGEFGCEKRRRHVEVPVFHLHQQFRIGDHRLREVVL